MSIVTESDSELLKRLWGRHREVTTFNGASIYRDAAESIARLSQKLLDAENLNAIREAALKRMSNEQRPEVA